MLSEKFFVHSDFFNWNKVKIRYCDGASFSGHPESELKASLIYLGFESLLFVKFFNSVSWTMEVFCIHVYFFVPQNGTELFFRGQLIWETLMDEFLSLGLSNAKQVAFLTL